MPALTNDRQTRRREGLVENIGLAADEKVYEGGLVATDADGFAVNLATATATAIPGVALRRADATDADDGAVDVDVITGPHCFGNSADADEITDAHRGRTAYAVDDQTVALTDNAGARLPVGIIKSVDEFGVWVDVGAKASFVPLQVAALALNGTTPKSVVSPVTGFLVSATSVLSGALTTGNATLTIAIDGNAVTGGVITITQASSGAGDVDFAYPSAANFVKAGELITLTPGGTNDAVRTADAVLLIQV